MQGRWVGQWEGHWFGHPNGEQPGDVSGTTLFSIGAEGTLSAIGAMSGSGGMAFGATGALTGVGNPVAPPGNDCYCPLKIALQGLVAPLSPLAIAVQGLAGELCYPKVLLKPPDSAGSRTAKRARAITRKRYLDEDDAILMAIISAVTGDCLA